MNLAESLNSYGLKTNTFECTHLGLGSCSQSGRNRPLRGDFEGQAGRKKMKRAITMAHPVVVDDDLGASPFFLSSLWLTMNNHNSERHAICCHRQQVFPMTVERCGSPPCHAWWRLYSAVWVCQFYEARYRTRRRGYPWASDHLPYDGRGLASADVAALW